MSADRISIAILEEFIKKVRLASKSKQKEVKLSIDEAENIIHHLSLVSLHLLDKHQKEETQSQNEVISVIMDGGSLE